MNIASKDSSTERFKWVEQVFEDICLLKNTDFIEIYSAPVKSWGQHMFHLKINLINFAM